MATSTPNVQQRNQYGRDWGNYASISVCPNASAWAGGTDPAAPLEVGDTAYVTGVGRVYCSDAGTSGGLDAVWSRSGAQDAYDGFQSLNLADYYVVPGASGGTVCPGADDFIFVVLAVPFVTRDGTGYDMIAQNAGGAGGAARGWRLQWANGSDLEADVYVTGPGVVTAISAAATYSADYGKLGHMHALAIRCYQSAGNTVLELWCGPARIAVAVGVGGVLPASNAADVMTIASGVVFGNERALNGGIYGVGYYEGTRTDDQMRALMGRCLTELRIPDDVVWDSRWQGVDVVTAPATWAATDGGVALDRAGTPTGSSAFFPTA